MHTVGRSVPGGMGEMNRQQRRIAAQKKAVEYKYMNQIIDHNERVDQHQITLGLVSMALALHKLYGWKDEIQRVIDEYVAQITRINDGETVDDLVAELAEQADIRIRVE